MYQSRTEHFFPEEQLHGIMDGHQHTLATCPQSSQKWVKLWLRELLGESKATDVNHRISQRFIVRAAWISVFRSLIRLASRKLEDSSDPRSLNDREFSHLIHRCSEDG